MSITFDGKCRMTKLQMKNYWLRGRLTSCHSSNRRFRFTSER